MSKPIEDHFWKYPGMYIGKKSIYGLQCFLCGCALSGSLFKFNREEFEDWVAEKTGKKLNGRSFAVATLLTDTDEKAFDLWESWYKEFQNEECE
jgi:hypothetical protein